MNWVFQERICLVTCSHTEIEIADQTCCHSHSWDTGTGPVRPRTDRTIIIMIIIIIIIIIMMVMMMMVMIKKC